MDFIIQKIKQIIDGEIFKIEFFNNEIVFLIYEVEIEISLNLNTGEVLLFCNNIDDDSYITVSMMEELTTIMNLIDVYKDGIMPTRTPLDFELHDKEKITGTEGSN